MRINGAAIIPLKTEKINSNCTLIRRIIFIIIPKSSQRFHFL